MIETHGWASRIRRELTENILPFWMLCAVDRENGGFYGKIDCDGNADPRAPRAAVVNARILWTFAAACRVLGGQYREPIATGGHNSGIQ